MLYMLDTANIKEIKELYRLYPIHGVTTNPSILAKEGLSVSKVIPEIQKCIGNTMLHFQVISSTADDIVKETLKYKNYFDFGEQYYTKVPVTPEGIKAIKLLKDKGFNVTATAVFTQQQALIAATAGADFVAPYVNRLDNISSHGIQVVTDIKKMFTMYQLKTKVLAASFKNVDQIYRVCMSGTDAITINPDLFETMVHHPMTDESIVQFIKDSEKIYDI